MEKIIYHALGICGEHWHPNVFTLGIISVGMYFIYKLYTHKTNGKTKIN